MLRRSVIWLFVLAAYCNASGQQLTKERDVTYLMGLHRASVGNNIGSLSFFELGRLSIEEERDFLYYVPVLSWASFVQRDLDRSESQWSYGLPVNFAVFMIYESFLKGEDSDSFQTPDSKWKYLLFAPNCFVGERLNDRLYFSYGASTDYLFERDGNNPPGILARPFFGLTYQARNAYESRERNFPVLISLSVGPSYFWNFDGASTFDSWMIRLSLIGGVLD